MMKKNNKKSCSDYLKELAIQVITQLIVGIILLLIEKLIFG